MPYCAERCSEIEETDQKSLRHTLDTTVTVTAWIGNREYGAPLLSSDVSEHGERRAIIASELDLDHVTDVLTNVCRNANVLIYKVSDMALSEASPDLRETWTKLVPATANHMTVSELVLDGCTVKVPRDSDATPDTIVIGMLERFRRVLEIRLR